MREENNTLDIKEEDKGVINGNINDYCESDIELEKMRAKIFRRNKKDYDYLMELGNTYETE